MKYYYTYIARCADKTLYTGYCVDLKKREAAHNNGTGAKYTKARRPVKIVYSEKFKTLSKALKREWAIKKLSKIRKEELIKDWEMVDGRL